MLRSLELDLDSLRRTKPDIILTTVTGFGAGGPLSHKHGFDGIGQAMSGAVYLSGTPEQPIALKVPWVDFGTACLSAFGTMAALYERGKTGSGQKVEGALLRTAVAFANSLLIEQALTQVEPGRDRQSRLQLGPRRLLPDERRLDRRDGDRPADVPALVPHDRRGALARRPALRRRPGARRSRRDRLGADGGVVRRTELR